MNKYNFNLDDETILNLRDFDMRLVRKWYDNRLLIFKLNKEENSYLNLDALVHDWKNSLPKEYLRWCDNCENLICKREYSTKENQLLKAYIVCKIKWVYGDVAYKHVDSKGYTSNHGVTYLLDVKKFMDIVTNSICSNHPNFIKNSGAYNSIVSEMNSKIR